MSNIFKVKEKTRPLKVTGEIRKVTPTYRQILKENQATQHRSALRGFQK
jgi:hypothetical protein